MHFFWGAITGAAIVALFWCGEPDLTYDDGVHDGWAQTCNEIAAHDSSIESELEGAGIC